MAAANTIECIRSFVGEEIKGVLIGSRPAPGTHNGDMRTYTLVLASGRGFTFAANPGGYMVWWEEQPDDLKRELARRADELRATGVDLADVLAMAGES